jgi:hypothetical protein
VSWSHLRPASSVMMHGVIDTVTAAAAAAAAAVAALECLCIDVLDFECLARRCTPDFR